MTKRMSDERDDLQALSTPPSGSAQQQRLVNVIVRLGDRNVAVLEEIKASNHEQRRTNRLVKVGIAISVVLTAAFLAGAWMNYAATVQYNTATSRYSDETRASIESAKQELQVYAAEARAAADRASENARRAAAEGALAQAEAAETQVRLVPPRERPEVQRKVEERRERARDLLLDDE